MRYKTLHKWDISPREAVSLQRQLAGMVRFADIDLQAVHHVAGVDVSVKNGLTQCAIVVLSYPDLSVIEIVHSRMPVTFPYVPGLLSFREAPVILKAVEKLELIPDVFVFDGHGITHPRRMGLASHLGLFLEKPSIGCAKNPLFGTVTIPSPKKGSARIIKDPSGAVIGKTVRTRDSVKPVFISPGHLADIDTSVKLILSCSKGLRIPEPTRQAHIAASLAGK